jgi:hypothetical protein
VVDLAEVMTEQELEAMALLMQGDIRRSLDLIRQYGGIDGAHHKQWVLDQVVRALTGPGYQDWVAAQRAGEDGPETYDWDEGVAP